MARVSYELRPFTVPNFVIVDVPARSRQEGYQEAPKYALHELPDEVLEDLCAEFRRNVLAKAGKDREALDAAR